MGSEEQLLGEIQYLTKLIESHKASRGPSSAAVNQKTKKHPSHDGKSRQHNWNNTTSYKYSKTAPQSHGHSSQTSKANQRTKRGNLVYCPTVKTDSRGGTVIPPTTSKSLNSTSEPRHPSHKDSLSRPQLPSKKSHISGHGIDGKMQTNSSKSGVISTSAHNHRKRKPSKSKVLIPSPKKQKNNKYVWKASAENESTQLSLPLHNQKLPGKQQLKWRRPSLDKKQSKQATVPNLKLITNAKVNPGAKSLSSKSNKHSPVKSRYKWRRRTSSESRAALRKVPHSPLVAKGKYSLIRSSLLKNRQNSFQYRRLKYIMKHTPSRLHQKRTSTNFTNSKNRVWVASSSEGEQTSSKQTGQQGSGESKSRRGNKVWVANRKSPTKKTSATSLVLLGGKKYMMDNSKRRLKRTSSSSVPRLSSTSSAGKLVSVKNYLASCAVQKSRKHIWLGKRHRNKVLDKFKHYCIFYNRFGKCSRGVSCPYVHDPQRVAICPKFLKGACEKTDGSCLLSHKVNKEKMPVCSFFLRGVCNRDSCPYLHVSVDRNASVCPDFVTGFCPRGEQCTLKHILDCPDFLASGKCPKGKACPLRHQKIQKKNSEPTSSRVHTASVKTPLAFRKVNQKRANLPSEGSPDLAAEKTVFVSNPGELEFMPLNCDQAPDFIAL